MLYPINPLMNNEELIQFNRLRYLTQNCDTLQERLITLISERTKRWVLLGKTERRQVAAQAALADVLANDPKNQRAIKDAETEVENCVKLITRLTTELNFIAAQDASTGRQYDELEQRRHQVAMDYPVAYQAYQNWSGVRQR